MRGLGEGRTRTKSKPQTSAIGKSGLKTILRSGASDMAILLSEKLAISVLELAEVLSVGRNVAYELVNRTDFPAVRIGERRIIIPVDRLKEWLTNQGEVFHGQSNC